MIVAAIIFAFITGFLGRYIAKQKGRSGAEGFWIGFLFSLLGVIIVALMPTVYKTEKKINYERDNAVKEAVSIKSSSSSTTHLTDKEIELIAKEQNKKDTKSNIFLTVFLIVLVGWGTYSLYQNKKEIRNIKKSEIEKPIEIFEEKKKKPKPKPKPKKVSLEKQVSSLIKSFDKLIISDKDANSIAKSFVVLEKDFIQSRKITSAKQLEVNYKRGSFEGYYRILLDYNGIEVYKSAPFKSRLSQKEAKSIEKLISEKSKSYRDLIKEIVVYDDVVNTIEIDLVKLDINLEKINRVEIIKLLNYSIQVTLYDNNKLLSRINSTIPSSWLDRLELKKVYSASVEPKP